MDEKELKEIFEFLQKAGANPQLCDTEVPYFEASVRAGLPTENFAEEAFVEMMSLSRKGLHLFCQLHVALHIQCKVA